MFFPFLAAAIVGAGAVKLGAMSVTISIMTAALQALIFANLIGAGYFLWQRYNELNSSNAQHHLSRTTRNLASPRHALHWAFFRPFSGGNYDSHQRKGSWSWRSPSSPLSPMRSWLLARQQSERLMSLQPGSRPSLAAMMKSDITALREALNYSSPFRLNAVGI